MARHQHGIFAEGTRAHHHLEFTLLDGVDHDHAARALEQVREANADHRTNGGTNLVIGLGPALCELLPAAAPRSHLADFPGYRSPDGALVAPATQHDLWIWVHGTQPDLVIDVIRAVVKALEPVAQLVVDQPGFVYHDSRDLTGFVDGTANPYLDDAPGIVLLDGDVDGSGTYAMTMRFVHDLDAFHALAVDEQEDVIGRTKPESLELPAERKPADSHIGRAEVEDDQGDELKVYRRSVPFATAAEQGLLFVAFGADTARFDLQMRHMYGLVDDGLTDRLLQFTTAETGSFWFCPSVDALEREAPLPDED